MSILEVQSLMPDIEVSEKPDSKVIEILKAEQAKNGTTTDEDMSKAKADVLDFDSAFEAGIKKLAAPKK
jgi:putative transposase